MKTLRVGGTRIRPRSSDAATLRHQHSGTPGLRPRRVARVRIAIAIGWLIASASVIGIGTALAQATYYVDNRNASCSDVGAGTQAQPYCTIGAALAAHHDPGTTMNVLPGLYREQVTLPASGLSGSPIILKAVPGPGQPVVVDGTDDFTSTALWSQSSGDVWLAASVTWAPRQVFADDARLSPSTLAPASLPAKSFEYVAGVGLFVNAGGGNPGSHRTQVGHRPYGFLVSGKSWVTIDAFTIVWTAGVYPPQLVRDLPLRHVPDGRVIVDECLRAVDPEGRALEGVYVIGDCAGARRPDGRLQPQLSQTAIAMGQYVGNRLVRRARGLDTGPFKFHDAGYIISLGKHSSVLELFGVPLSGRLAWLAWAGAYLVKMVGFRKQLEVGLDHITHLVFEHDTAQILARRNVLTDDELDFTLAGPAGSEGAAPAADAARAAAPGAPGGGARTSCLHFAAEAVRVAGNSRASAAAELRPTGGAGEGRGTP